MNWENLEEILKSQEKDLEKEANKTQIIDLNARIEKIQNILKKPDLGLPTLIGSEVTPKRKKLSTVLNILVSVRDRKEKERFEQNQQAQEKWKNETLKNILHNLRCAYGTAVNHLMSGSFTMEVPDWFEPKSTQFEIQALSGHKLKIDLEKLITPSRLQRLLDKAFIPIYILVEPSGGYDRHGKRMGYFMSSEWNESHGIEIRPATTMAIMRV